MTYLAPERYFGIDPNRWLIDDAIEFEIGHSMVTIKKPRFAYHDDGTMTLFRTSFDFIHAHSILTHAPPQLAQAFFGEAGKVLKPNGLVIATFLRGDSDYAGRRWAYPDVIQYRLETMSEWAGQAALQLVPIRWPHRNQTYFVAYRRDFDPGPVFDDAFRTYGIRFV